MGWIDPRHEVDLKQFAATGFYDLAGQVWNRVFTARANSRRERLWNSDERFGEIVSRAKAAFDPAIR